MVPPLRPEPVAMLVTVPPALIVLQPNPTPSCQVRALEPPTHDGTASAPGVVAVSEPSNVLAGVAAKAIVPALVMVPPLNPVPAVMLDMPPPPPVPQAPMLHAPLALVRHPLVEGRIPAGEVVPLETTTEPGAGNVTI